MASPYLDAAAAPMRAPTVTSSLRRSTLSPAVRQVRPAVRLAGRGLPTNFKPEQQASGRFQAGSCPRGDLDCRLTRANEVGTGSVEQAAEVSNHQGRCGRQPHYNSSADHGYSCLRDARLASILIAAQGTSRTSLSQH